MECDKARIKLGSQVAPGSKADQLGRILNPDEILLIDLHVPYADSTYSFHIALDSVIILNDQF